MAWTAISGLPWTDLQRSENPMPCFLPHYFTVTLMVDQPTPRNMIDTGLLESISHHKGREHGVFSLRTLRLCGESINFHDTVINPKGVRKWN